MPVASRPVTGVIVHEWIEKNGGAERVLAALVDAFPGADVITPWDDAPGALGSATVHESWLARTPLRHSKAAAVPFLLTAWRTLAPAHRPRDWVLVATHLFAHHARLRGAAATAPKLVYAYTPARYIWTPDLDLRGDHPALRLVGRLLKPLDRRRAREALAVAGISRFIAARIAATWGIEAEVIYPPVDVVSIQAVTDWRTRLDPDECALLAGLPEGFLLGASRMVPYKRLDRVIRAGELVDRPVVIAGGGPQEAALRTLARSASVPVSIVDRPSDALLRALYQRCQAFLFLPIEDFGIMPIEAMAAGAMVVVNREGGAAETLDVVGHDHGEAVDPDDDDDLARGVKAVLARAHLVPAEATQAFSRERFIDEIRDFVARHTL